MDYLEFYDKNRVVRMRMLWLSILCKENMRDFAKEDWFLKLVKLADRRSSTHWAMDKTRRTEAIENNISSGRIQRVECVPNEISENRQKTLDISTCLINYWMHPIAPVWVLLPCFQFNTYQLNSKQQNIIHKPKFHSKDIQNPKI